jgi:hypothetical protein
MDNINIPDNTALGEAISIPQEKTGALYLSLFYFEFIIS